MWYTELYGVKEQTSGLFVWKKITLQEIWYKNLVTSTDRNSDKVWRPTNQR